MLREVTFCFEIQNLHEDLFSKNDRLSSICWHHQETPKEWNGKIKSFMRSIDIALDSLVRQNVNHKFIRGIDEPLRGFLSTMALFESCGSTQGFPINRSSISGDRTGSVFYYERNEFTLVTAYIKSVTVRKYEHDVCLLINCIFRAWHAGR